MLGMSEELKVSASVLIRERELAHKRGYAEGLEAAANTVSEFFLPDSGKSHALIAETLRNEARRVRELEITQ